MRVYELSKELNISNKKAVEVLRQNNFEAASHMSVLSAAAIEFLRNKFSLKEMSEKIETALPKEIAMSVPSEKSKVDKEVFVESAQKEENVAEEIKESPVVGEIVAEPMLVADFANKVERPVTEVIITLLKKGVVCTKNQRIPAEMVAQIAKSYGLTVVEPKKKLSLSDKVSIGGGSGQERTPVVVVIGHVDHGKTTLLDYIRKSRIAAKEKGGITQHLGAYEVKTGHGEIVFLDTPGHEAFSKMRARGVRVADIAILVVAADDGVKPQTIEAIKHAQSVQVPIVVALNKIDKVSENQIESAKRSLAKVGLMPEEWGGETIVVPISAKTGMGVDQLLEIISLQAQLMELKANRSGPGQGFVLEAKLEKGFGSVATIIGQEGKISLGDYFVAGDVVGKVSSLINSSGVRLQAVGPSIPVRIAGFDSLPEAGDFFRVIPQDEYKKLRFQEKERNALDQELVMGEESAVNILVKADNNSSKEAILGAIDQLNNSTENLPIRVIHAAVGDINESDIALANNTKAIIYGFHVKSDAKAVIYAQRVGVVLNLYQIIYQLLDALEERVKKAQIPTMVQTKVGSALVICTFNIKNVGVIAGAKVLEGRLVKESRLVVNRGRQKIGEGTLKSLEREKRSVKEVHAGFECALVVEGFQDWEVDDRIECFIEVPASSGR